MQNNVTETDKTNVLPELGILCDVREVEIVDVRDKTNEELLFKNREQRYICANNKILKAGVKITSV